MSQIKDVNSNVPMTRIGKFFSIVGLTNAWGFSLLLAPGIAWYGLNNGVGFAMMYLGVLGLVVIPTLVAFFSLFGLILAWPLSKLSPENFVKFLNKGWRLLLIALVLVALCSIIRGALGLT
ncbi:hypothetical protein EC844_12152 [Acinetobacter calcoaceticus]|uniref:Uncharacterized protein n=1 Tax=Acinetobacter calcoaceticus TaxID=471 RepID=A0A4R1XH93_ACICA|nr:hypothetical protein EC844_12152 [Acinetobacter calcoaceticus]